MHTSGDWDLLVGEKRRGGGDEKYVAPRVTDRHILRSSNSSSTSVSSSLFFFTVNFAFPSVPDCLLMGFIVFPRFDWVLLGLTGFDWV